MSVPSPDQPVHQQAQSAKPPLRKRLLAILVPLGIVVVIAGGSALLAPLFRDAGVSEERATAYLEAISTGDESAIEAMTDIPSSVFGPSETDELLHDELLAAAVTEHIEDVRIVEIEASQTERTGRRSSKTTASIVTFEYSLAGKDQTGKVEFSRSGDDEWMVSTPPYAVLSFDLSSGLLVDSLVLNGVGDVSAVTRSYLLLPGVYEVAGTGAMVGGDVFEWPSEEVELPANTEYTLTLG